MSAGQRYRERVRELGCIMERLGFGAECFANNGGVEIHHPREGEGAAQRAEDWLGTPLCWQHHQGPLGIHRLKSFYARTKLDEMDLLAATIEAMNRG
jgi:hypothetical protein